MIIWKKGVEVSWLAKSGETKKQIQGQLQQRANKIAQRNKEKNPDTEHALTALGVEPGKYLQRGGGGAFELAVDGQAGRSRLRKRRRGYNLIFHAAHPAEHGVLLRMKPK